MIILNDLHLGAKRQGGTTPASQAQLQNYLAAKFRQFVGSLNTDLLIAGDLFDSFEADTRTVLDCYNTLADYLSSGSKTLALVAGNHDHNPRGDKMSAFHFLSALLVSRFGDQVKVIDSVLTEVGHGVWAIPHMPNQDLFDLELERALGLRTGHIAGNGLVDLIVHANYANKFTEHSDHSLNVSREFAAKFVEAGGRILFAHEHQAKKDFDGKVWIMGNQWPSSVADCLGNNFKYAHRLEGSVLSAISTWSVTDPSGYAEMDWQELVDIGVAFIRITGTATAEQAEAVVEAVAKFRKDSNAYVVSNAVKVDGMQAMDALEEASAESIKAFDVLGALLEGLSEREADILRGLL